MSFTRWIFTDLQSGVTYTLPKNPITMTSPLRDKAIGTTETTAKDGQVILTEGRRQPKPWTFSGTLRTEADYNEMKLWFDKSNRVAITDHYGRTFDTVFTQLAVTPKRAVGQPWLMAYEASVLVLGEPR